MAGDHPVGSLFLQQQRVRPPAEPVRLAVLILQRSKAAPAVPMTAHRPALRVRGADQSPGLIVSKGAAFAVGPLMGHRQALSVPGQALFPALRPRQQQRTACRVVTVAGLFPVGRDFRAEPARSMVTVAGHAPGAVRGADELACVVILPVTAVSGGVHLLHHQAILIPVQERALPEGVNDAGQAVVRIVVKARDPAVRLRDGHRQGAVRKPLRRPDVAVRVRLLHPVAGVVILEGHGMAGGVGAAHQLLIPVPLIPPAFTALIHKAGNQLLCVPVVPPRLPVVLRDGGQPGLQVIRDAAAVTGAGPGLHHPPVVRLLPAVLTLQAARQAVPDHQAVVVVAVFPRGHPTGVGGGGQLPACVVTPAHQGPGLLPVKNAWRR